MVTSTPLSTVLVLDFGAQYGQLIARRVRDLNVYSEIVPCDISADEVREKNPGAIILSGGPASVYAEDAPSVDPEIFELGIPVLGFCYGQQIMAKTLGGTVSHTEKGEYGPAPLTRVDGVDCAGCGGTSALYGETPHEQTVWMSHRDAVSEVPEGFAVTAVTDVCPWLPWNAPSESFTPRSSILKFATRRMAKRCWRTSCLGSQGWNRTGPWTRSSTIPWRPFESKWKAIA